MLDAPSFLWRLELAGQPHDADRWQKVRAFADRAFPAPGIPFADWHVALTDAATGRDPAPRIAAIEALDAAGRYNGGPTVPAVARGFAAFAAGDWPAAIAALESMIDSVDRMAGSRAQLDLLEFTLLRAYLAAGRTPDARHLLAARVRGPRPPVAGVEALAAA